jgi:hypothetical protein
MKKFPMKNRYPGEPREARASRRLGADGQTGAPEAWKHLVMGSPADRSADGISSDCRRRSYVAAGHAHREHIHRRLPGVPLGSVHGQYLRRTHGREIKEKRAEDRAIHIVPLRKPLNAAVIGGGLHAGLQRQSQPLQVGRGMREKRDGGAR